MSIGTTFGTKKLSGRGLLASGLLAGLMTLGFVAPAGAAAYGGYGGYENNFDASSGQSYSESHESSVTLATSESYSSKASCDYSAQMRYDAYSGSWHRMGYNYDTGMWYSCEQEESYQNSLFYNEFQKHTVDFSSFDNFSASNNRY